GYPRRSWASTISNTDACPMGLARSVNEDRAKKARLEHPGSARWAAGTSPRTSTATTTWMPWMPTWRLRWSACSGRRFSRSGHPRYWSSTATFGGLMSRPDGPPLLALVRGGRRRTARARPGPRHLDATARLRWVPGADRGRQPAGAGRRGVGDGRPGHLRV